MPTDVKPLERRVLYQQPAKLYFFDDQPCKWKEKGPGEASLERNCRTGQEYVQFVYRMDGDSSALTSHVVVSHDQHCNLRPNAGSKRCWTWSATESVPETKMLRLALKFENPDLAERFRAAFEHAKQINEARTDKWNLQTRLAGARPKAAQPSVQAPAPVPAIAAAPADPAPTGSIPAPSTPEASTPKEASTPRTPQTALVPLVASPCPPTTGAPVGFTLKVSGDRGYSKHFVLQPGPDCGSVRIGRAQTNEMCVSYLGVSTLHAELTLTDEGGLPSLPFQLCLRDLSTNGTLLIKPLGKRIPLRKGDYAIVPDGSKVMMPMMTKTKAGEKERQLRITVSLDGPGGPERSRKEGTIKSRQRKAADGGRKSKKSDGKVAGDTSSTAPIAQEPGTLPSAPAPPTQGSTSPATFPTATGGQTAIPPFAQVLAYSQEPPATPGISYAHAVAVGLISPQPGHFPPSAPMTPPTPPGTPPSSTAATTPQSRILSPPPPPGQATAAASSASAAAFATAAASAPAALAAAPSSIPQPLAFDPNWRPAGVAEPFMEFTSNQTPKTAPARSPHGMPSMPSRTLRPQGALRPQGSSGNTSAPELGGPPLAIEPPPPPPVRGPDGQLLPCQPTKPCVAGSTAHPQAMFPPQQQLDAQTQAQFQSQNFQHHPFQQFPQQSPCQQQQQQQQRQQYPGQPHQIMRVQQPPLPPQPLTYHGQSWSSQPGQAQHQSLHVQYQMQQRQQQQQQQQQQQHQQQQQQQQQHAQWRAGAEGSSQSLEDASAANLDASTLLELFAPPPGTKQDMLRPTGQGAAMRQTVPPSRGQAPDTLSAGRPGQAGQAAPVDQARPDQTAMPPLALDTAGPSPRLSIARAILQQAQQATAVMLGKPGSASEGAPPTLSPSSATAAPAGAASTASEQLQQGGPVLAPMTPQPATAPMTPAPNSNSLTSPPLAPPPDKSNSGKKMTARKASSEAPAPLSPTTVAGELVGTKRKASVPLPMPPRKAAQAQRELPTPPPPPGPSVAPECPPPGYVPQSALETSVKDQCDGNTEPKAWPKNSTGSSGPPKRPLPKPAQGFGSFSSRKGGGKAKGPPKKSSLLGHVPPKVMPSGSWPKGGTPGSKAGKEKKPKANSAARAKDIAEEKAADMSHMCC